MALSTAFQISLAAGQLKNWYWLAPYLWGVSGLSFVIWMVLNAKQFFVNTAKQQSVSMPIPSQTQQDVSSSVKDSGNSNIVQNFFTGPSPIAASPVLPRTTKAEEPKPHIVFLRAKAINITLGLDNGFYEATDNGDIDGIKACFRNEAVYGQVIRDAFGIKAHVRLRDKNGNEIGEGVSGVQWLGIAGEEVNIRKNESACVCILIFTRGKERKCAVPFMKRVGAGNFGGSRFIYDGVELPEVPSSVEVYLTDEKGMLLPSVIINITVDENEIKVKTNN
ncbi:MAG TPA: hypothetical protein VFK06_09270 [Candidatus Angelobacter sp.]|nr:hypothetical protein [Candidatus Angelobacter sp.]